MSKILITGSRGFIGSHLADSLEDGGHEIVHYDIKDGDDVLDLENLKEKGKDVDGIVHFAAIQRVITGYENPTETIETNILGLNNVLKVAMNNEAWILFGSSKTVFGNPETNPIRESDEKKPSNIYSLTKLMSEKIINDFCSNYGLKGTTVRFSTVFGSERDILDRAIPTFIYKALNDIDLKIEDQERVLDPTLIDDVVLLLVKATEKLDSEESGFYDDYNIVSGEGHSIREIVEIILDATNSEAEIISSTDARDYDKGDLIGDPTKIKEEFGFQPTPFREAIEIYKERFKQALENDRWSEEEIEHMLNYFERKKTKKN